MHKKDFLRHPFRAARAKHISTDVQGIVDRYFSLRGELFASFCRKRGLKGILAQEARQKIIFDWLSTKGVIESRIEACEQALDELLHLSCLRAANLIAQVVNEDDALSSLSGNRTIAPPLAEEALEACFPECSLLLLDSEAVSSETERISAKVKKALCERMVPSMEHFLTSAQSIVDCALFQLRCRRIAACIEKSIASDPSCGFRINKSALENLLIEGLSIGDLTAIERNPSTLLNLLKTSAREQEIDIPNYPATRKGAIGHDLLNVRTFSPEEWRNRTRRIFNKPLGAIMQEAVARKVAYTENLS